VFAHHGLKVVDVDRLATHGGSLRIYASHSTAGLQSTARYHDVIAEELAAGLAEAATYERFGAAVIGVKCDVLEFLISALREGKTVVGYGAPAKGNTLLNYCGVGTELMRFTVDRSPHKQGRYLPGSQIPIFAPEHIMTARPDYVFILPWNLRDEIVEQMHAVREWGGRFVVPIPRVEVL
jgi:hypothetical protein